MDSQTKILDELNVLNDPSRPLTKINSGLQNVLYEGFNGLTRVTLVSVPGRGYSGELDLTYRRIDITPIVDAGTIQTPEPMTPAKLLEMVNNVWGLTLTTDDVDPFDVSTPTEDVSTDVYLSVVSESLGYVGAGQLMIQHGRYTLQQVVGRRRLNELMHPVAGPLRGKSSRMMTWDKDFTSVRDAIRPDAFRRYSDWDRLQNACAAYGIPVWTERTITDHATSEIPDANPAFDRVVIQSVVESAEIFGPLYFHYNVLEEI